MMTISATLQVTITFALAEAVGQVAGRRGEQNIGQHEAAGAERQDGADLECDAAAVDVFLADADHEPAEDVVVRRAEKLREQQAEERDRQEPIVLFRLVRRDRFESDSVDGGAASIMGRSEKTGSAGSAGASASGRPREVRNARARGEAAVAGVRLGVWARPPRAWAEFHDPTPAVTALTTVPPRRDAGQVEDPLAPRARGRHLLLLSSAG